MVWSWGVSRECHVLGLKEQNIKEQWFTLFISPGALMRVPSEGGTHMKKQQTL